jgi:hypothetical protein
VELYRGVLTQTAFLRDDEYYKLIKDRYVILPKGASSYFGVIRIGDRSEDEELTRQVFGGTTEEFESIAYALARRWKVVPSSSSIAAPDVFEDAYK